MKASKPMVEVCKRAIRDLSRRMDIPIEVAADILMAELEKIQQQKKLGLSTKLFAKMSYNPIKDPDHPMHGWHPN